MEEENKRKIQEAFYSNIEILLSVPETSNIGKKMVAQVSNWNSKEFEFITKIYTKEKFQWGAKENNLVLLDKNIKSDYSSLILLPTKCEHPDYLSNIYRATRVITSDICLGVILDGVPNKLLVEKIHKILQDSDINYALYSSEVNVGYVYAIKFAYDSLFTERIRYVGFLDDDAYITRDDHYKFLIKGLEQKPNIYAISGLAVDKNNGGVLHDFFNLGTDFEFYKQLQLSKVFLDRPHIHGGGGAMLMRQPDFLFSVNESLKHGTMIGPTISSLARSKGLEARASAKSLVLHPIKSNLYSWAVITKKYFNSWSILNEVHQKENMVHWKSFQEKALKVAKHNRSQDDYIRIHMLSMFRAQFDRFYID